MKKKPTTMRQRMRELSQRGVAARQAKRAAQLVPRAIWPLEGREPQTIEDWQKLGAAAAKAMWTGGLPHQVAKEIASLVRAALAAFKVGDLAERVAAYEALVEQLRRNAKTGGT